MAIEDQLFKQNGPSDLPNGNFAAASPPAAVPGVYQRGVPVHSQPLFTTAILTALKQVDDYLVKLLNRESIFTLHRFPEIVSLAAYGIHSVTSF